MAQNILLDDSIRDWVLLPLIVIMLLVGLARHYLTVLLRTNKRPKVSAADDANLVAYSRVLLQNGIFLSPEGFRSRVERLINPSSGVLHRKIEYNPMEAMSNPDMMGEMMKGQITGMVPHIGMMMLVQSLFSGFVIAKFPFSLSSRFRGMVQRGVEIDALECSYVTSLSMFLLISTGLEGVLKVLLGENAADNAAMMQRQMGQTNQPVDYSKEFKAIADELQFATDRYKYALDDALLSLSKIE